MRCRTWWGIGWCWSEGTPARLAGTTPSVRPEPVEGLGHCTHYPFALILRQAQDRVRLAAYRGASAGRAGVSTGSTRTGLVIHHPSGRVRLNHTPSVRLSLSKGWGIAPLPIRPDPSTSSGQGAPGSVSKGQRRSCRGFDRLNPNGSGDSPSGPSTGSGRTGTGDIRRAMGLVGERLRQAQGEREQRWLFTAATKPPASSPCRSTSGAPRSAESPSTG